MVKFAVGPCQAVRGWLHASWLSVLLVFVEVLGDCGVKVGMFVGMFVGRTVPTASEVGNGGGVFVGKAVGAGVSVGGRGVAVGFAASV